MSTINTTKWKVKFSNKANKEFLRLSKKIQILVVTLVGELETKGPIIKNWPNFSALEKGKYHCHIKKGRPTYVACWSVEDKKMKIIEVYYVGTHEDAPY